MKITVNGEHSEIENGTLLSKLINDLNYDIRLIAIEYNYTIPAKEEYKNIVLKEGDTVEIVTFMGGG